MSYFVERIDGQFELFQGTVDLGSLPEDVLSVYIVSEKHTRTMSFNSESLVPKRKRRFRCQDGQLRTREEMSLEDVAFLASKMANARNARAARAPKAA